MPLFAPTGRAMMSSLGLDAHRASGVLGETIPRNANQASNGTITSGVIYLQQIWLFAGDIVSNIGWKSGTTAFTRGSNLDSHLWFALFDSSRVMVACTADDTSGAWGASAIKTLAIANIASGASATYTVPASAMYYLGVMAMMGTGGSPAVPNIAAANHLDGVTNTSAPILEGSSTTGQTTAPAFPFTAAALTATGSNKYGRVT